jgi:predicted metal-binding integral membrane protein DUF2182
VTAGLLALAGLAWAYIVREAALMPAHHGMAMPQAGPWNVGETAALVIMWTVMMMAMMIPSVAPVILLFATVSRRRRLQGVVANPSRSSPSATSSRGPSTRFSPPWHSPSSIPRLFSRPPWRAGARCLAGVS